MHSIFYANLNFFCEHCARQCSAYYVNDETLYEVSNSSHFVSVSGHVRYGITKGRRIMCTCIC